MNTARGILFRRLITSTIHYSLCQVNNFWQPNKIRISISTYCRSYNYSYLKLILLLVINNALIILLDHNECIVNEIAISSYLIINFVSTGITDK